MSTDLSNREGQIFDFMKEVLKESFPDADLRNDGPFMETFGTPHVKMFEPVLTFLDRLKLMQSLDNAGSMTQEEMDEVAFSHYMSRDMGRRSTGLATFVLEDFPSTGVLVIPAGLELTSKGGEKFLSNETITLDEVSLAAYYDAATFSYRIPVPLIAESPGEKYNIEVGDVIELSRGEVPHLIEVTNDVAFVGGTDSETNLQLANRIIESRFSHNLGTKRGYTRYMTSFDGVKEVEIAGYGHPLMKRDIIGSIHPPNITLNVGARDLHWGTKIDAYIRGENPVERTEYLEVQSDGANLFVELKEVPVLDVIDVRLYSFDGEFDDVNIDQSTLYVTDYSLVKNEDFETEGTIQEDSKLVISDDRLSVGKYVRVVYRYNELVRRIHDALYTGDERSLTADVKVKEANKKFVFGGIVASMKAGMSMKESDRSMIRQRLKGWIDQLRMGEELQFSDLQEPLYAMQSPDDQSAIDYVHLPYQFIVLENNNRHIFYCMSEKKRKAIDSLAAEAPFLYEVFNRYKDVVTTYDFFDLLHSYTQDNGFDDNINKLQYKSGILASIAGVFPQIREMAVTSLISKRLSPPKQEIDVNEYFSLGESFIYDAKPYEEKDWEQMLLLSWNIAIAGDLQTEDLKLVYHLAVYVMTLVYLITNEEAEQNPELIRRFARKIVERTPVEFEFDL